MSHLAAGVSCSVVLQRCLSTFKSFQHWCWLHVNRSCHERLDGCKGWLGMGNTTSTTLWITGTPADKFLSCIWWGGVLISICLHLPKQEIVIPKSTIIPFFCNHVLCSHLSYLKPMKVLVLSYVFVGGFESYASEEISCDRESEQHRTLLATLQGF